MKIIKIIKPKDESLLHQLTALYLTFKNLPSRKKVEFDFSGLNWLFPLITLPIAAYIQDTNSTFISPKGLRPAFYLQFISFPEGVTSVSKIQRKKSYIPIAVLQRKDDPRKKERLETVFADMVYKVLKPTVAAENAVYCPLCELVNNIFEHSRKEKGYVFAQYYPKKKFLDLCIVDRGRGIAASYKEEKNLDFTDSEAIEQTLMGHSTKPERMMGYGIRISKRIICEGLGGGFILLSGKAALYSSKKEEKIFSLPKFYWQGVIAAYRIPQPQKPVDITPFLEG